MPSNGSFALAVCAPPFSSSVVVALLLVTVAVVAFLLYRYLCHNKGAYRTTGEPAPGEDFAEDGKSNQASADKKEYFI